MRDASPLLMVMNSKTTTGVGNYINVEGYRHLTAFIAFGNAPIMSIACCGSIGKGGSDGTQDESPDMTAAQSYKNSWDYIEMIDLESGSDINGDAGIEANAADLRIVNINTDGLKWLNFRVLTATAGAVTVQCKLFRD